MTEAKYLDNILDYSIGINKKGYETELHSFFHDFNLIQGDEEYTHLVLTENEKIIIEDFIKFLTSKDLIGITELVNIFSVIQIGESFYKGNNKKEFLVLIKKYNSEELLIINHKLVNRYIMAMEYQYGYSIGYINAICNDDSYEKDKKLEIIKQACGLN